MATPPGLLIDDIMANGYQNGGVGSAPVAGAQCLEDRCSDAPRMNNCRRRNWGRKEVHGVESKKGTDCKGLTGARSADPRGQNQDGQDYKEIG